MKSLLSKLFRWVISLGAIAAIITLPYLVQSGDLFSVGDDPYIAGYAVACVLAPSAFFYLVAEAYQCKVWQRVLWACVPLLLISPFLIYAALHGELHGPAIALFLLGASYLFIIILVLLLYWSARSQILRVILTLCTAAWALSYFSVFMMMR